MQLGEVVTLALEVSHQQVGQFHHVALADGEVQLHALGANVLQQSVQIGGIQLLGFQVEGEGVDALVQHVKSLGIGFLGIGCVNFLAHQPAVVVFLVASQVGEFAGQGIGSLQSLQVFPAVKGLYFKAFVGFPNEFLLKVRAFQVDGNFLHPRIGRDGRKVREEFFIDICHSLSI